MFTLATTGNSKAECGVLSQRSSIRLSTDLVAAVWAQCHNDLDTDTAVLLWNETDTSAAYNQLIRIITIITYTWQLMKDWATLHFQTASANNLQIPQHMLYYIHQLIWTGSWCTTNEQQDSAFLGRWPWNMASSLKTPIVSKCCDLLLLSTSLFHLWR